MQTLTPRDVPLGGLRAMTVRRTLPQRERTTIGAWCFVDHYGPSAPDQKMVVPPHPHTGLATASWLFTGEVEHRDSAGHHAMVRPGELNLMTAGHGISHSEVSTPESDPLHGVQLWLALPDASREVAPGFEHYVPEPVAGRGWTVRVFLGSLLGATSPVRTHTDLIGAELLVDAGATLEVPVDAAHEHGFLLDQGSVEIDGRPLAAHELGYVEPGATVIRITALEPTRLLVLGGAPFGEKIVMWWNFIGRSHEDVVEQRARWQHLLAEGADERFSLPEDDLPPLPAPELPNARLKQR